MDDFPSLLDVQLHSEEVLAHAAKVPNHSGKQTAYNTALENHGPEISSFTYLEESGVLPIILSPIGGTLQCGPRTTLVKERMLDVHLHLGEPRQAGAEDTKIQSSKTMISELHTAGFNRGASRVSKRSESSADSRSNQKRENDEDESGGLEPLHRSRGKRKLDTELFACPYYKYMPLQFYSSRACSGPGWKTVHRLKYLSCF
jgi:hypothetical protein